MFSSVLWLCSSSDVCRFWLRNRACVLCHYAPLIAICASINAASSHVAPWLKDGVDFVCYGRGCLWPARGVRVRLFGDHVWSFTGFVRGVNGCCARG